MTEDQLRQHVGAFSRFVESMGKAVDAARLAGHSAMTVDVTEVDMLVTAARGLLVALKHSGGRKPGPTEPIDPKTEAAWIRVALPTATFGALVCPACGVVECAPYGREMIGTTADSARAYLRSIRRDQWACTAKVACPRCAE